MLWFVFYFTVIQLTVLLLVWYRSRLKSNENRAFIGMIRFTLLNRKTQIIIVCRGRDRVYLKNSENGTVSDNPLKRQSSKKYNGAVRVKNSGGLL